MCVEDDKNANLQKCKYIVIHIHGVADTDNVKYECTMEVMI